MSTLSLFHVEHSTFGMRLRYLRWRAHLIEGDPPGWADIGRAVDYTGEGVSKWRLRDDPPDSSNFRRPLAEFFGLKSADWLMDGVGDPPDEDLWKLWTRHRRAELKASGADLQEVTRADVAAGRQGGKAKKAR